MSGWKPLTKDQKESENKKKISSRRKRCQDFFIDTKIFVRRPGDLNNMKKFKIEKLTRTKIIDGKANGVIFSVPRSKET